jgi:hypothetical protein
LPARCTRQGERNLDSSTQVDKQRHDLAMYTPKRAKGCAHVPGDKLQPPTRQFQGGWLAMQATAVLCRIGSLGEDERVQWRTLFPMVAPQRGCVIKKVAARGGPDHSIDRTHQRRSNRCVGIRGATVLNPSWRLCGRRSGDGPDAVVDLVGMLAQVDHLQLNPPWAARAGTAWLLWSPIGPCGDQPPLTGNTA